MFNIRYSRLEIHISKHLQSCARLSSAQTNSVRLIQVLSLMNELDSIYITCYSLVQAHPYGSSLQSTFRPIPNSIRPDKSTDWAGDWATWVYLSRMGLINNCNQNKAVPTVNILQHPESHGDSKSCSSTYEIRYRTSSSNFHFRVATTSNFTARLRYQFSAVKKFHMRSRPFVPRSQSVQDGVQTMKLCGIAENRGI